MCGWSGCTKMCQTCVHWVYKLSVYFSEMCMQGVRQLFEPLAEAMRGAGAEKPELRLGARIEQCSPASWVR